MDEAGQHPPDTAEGPTEALASFASRLRYDDIPQDVRSHAELCVLDALGCGIFASALPWSQIVNELVAERSVPGPATIWGTDLKRSADGAALANGTSGHGFELDDIHPAGVHPGPIAVSVALALGEEAGASGPDVLTAMVAGYEVGCRVAMSVLKGHAKAGFHAQGTVGTFVGVAAAGNLLRLSPEEMRNAFAVAGSMAAGLLVAQEGGMTKRLHSGRAAQSGVIAALLAQKGFTGVPDVLENAFGGFDKAMGGGAEDLGALTGGLGQKWETARVGFKIYSACGGAHSSLHAAKQLRREHDIDVRDVESVTAGLSSHAVMKVGAPYKPNGIASAQMNLGFVMALMLRFGDVPLDQLTEAGINDLETIELAERVRVLVDPEIDSRGSAGRHGSRVSIGLRDGQVFTTELRYRPGSDEMPVTDEDVREKFRNIAGQRLPPDQVEQIERAVFALHTVEQITTFTSLLAR